MGSEGEDDKRLGPWVLEEQIGAGGLSDVWRAPQPRRAIAALKILREPDRSEAHTRRFLREGLLLGRLEHASLPRCPAASEEPSPHLVLELLEGETLSEHLRTHGPMDPERASLVLENLLKVLHYLHQHGIIHRDVKPSNVYIARDRRVLLLDLGLAVDPEDPLTTTLGDVMGTCLHGSRTNRWCRGRSSMRSLQFGHHFVRSFGRHATISRGRCRRLSRSASQWTAHSPA